MAHLTYQQVNFFRQMGYYKLRDTISDKYISRMKAVVDDHILRQIKPYRANAMKRITHLEDITDRDPVFLEVVQSALILNPLESLLGPNVELVSNWHNRAIINAKGDNTVRFHRDVLQWSHSVISIIIYLEEATFDNGCTLIIPSSQHLPLDDANGVNRTDEYYIFTDLIDQAVPIPMPRGGVLLFDGRAIHSWGENRTAGTRASITLAFQSVDELDGVEDRSSRILILGERIYKGNDYYRISQ
jgi:phytanoyl-CoA hydroxylase